MNIPIRVIGIATTIFWIFLITFSATAAYSVKDLRFNFGEPQMSMTPNHELLFSLPIDIFNGGYYNIGRFEITTRVSNTDDSMIARGSSLVPTIRKGEAVTFLHNLTLGVAELLQDQRYLFQDTQMNIDALVGLRLAELIPVQASTNFSMPWGAPLYNFHLGEPQFAGYNLTHARTVIPVSFENHAALDLEGEIRLSMYNSAGILEGVGQTVVNAPLRSSYEGNIELRVEIPTVTPSGRFEASFQSPLFNYGPWVVPYG